MSESGEHSVRCHFCGAASRLGEPHARTVGGSRDVSARAVPQAEVALVWQGARISDRTPDPRLRGAFVWVHGPPLADEPETIRAPDGATLPRWRRIVINVATGEPPELLAIALPMVELLPVFRENVDVEDFEAWLAAQGRRDA